MKGKDSNRTQIYEKSRRTLSSIRAAASELKLSDILPLGSQKLIWLGLKKSRSDFFVTFLTQTNQQYSLTQAKFGTLVIFL